MTQSIRYSSSGPRGMTMTSFGAEGIKAEADRHYNQYLELTNRNNYWGAYHKLLRAKDLYFELPEGREKTRELMGTARCLAWVSTKIRSERRAVIVSYQTCCIYNMFFPCLLSPCVAYYCCKVTCCQTKWVDDEELTRYINKTKTLARGFIDALSEQYSITMGTHKNTVPDQVRRDIAYSYNQLGLISRLDDSFNPMCNCTCCCETGAVICQSADAEAVTFFREASAWDPENTEYAASAQRVDAYMKRPIVNVYHVTNS